MQAFAPDGSVLISESNTALIDQLVSIVQHVLETKVGECWSTWSTSRLMILYTYSRKIWRGIKFGGLTVCLSTAKLEYPPIFFRMHVHNYGNTVPYHQN